MPENKFIPIEDIVDVPESFYAEIDKLRENIKNQDIPTWLLIPHRRSGEHATDKAWLGVVMGLCASDSDVLKTRIAWDTEDRDRIKSTTGEVPDVLQDVVVKATEKTDNVEMCVANIQFNSKSREVVNIQVGLEVSEPDEETED